MYCVELCCLISRCLGIFFLPLHYWFLVRLYCEEINHIQICILHLGMDSSKTWTTFWYLIVLLTSFMFLLIFSLVVLLIAETGILKSSTVIMTVSILSLTFIIFCFIYCKASYLLHTHIFDCYVFLVYQSFYHYIMSFFVINVFALMSINIVISALFWLIFTWYLFPLVFFQSTYVHYFEVSFL